MNFHNALSVALCITSLHEDSKLIQRTIYEVARACGVSKNSLPANSEFIKLESKQIIYRWFVC